MPIKYEFDLVDIELGGIFYGTRASVNRKSETKTIFKAFNNLSNDGNLYLEFDGEDPEIEIDISGDLQIEEYEGMPEMYIDNAGDFIIEE